MKKIFETESAYILEHDSHTFIVSKEQIINCQLGESEVIAFYTSIHTSIIYPVCMNSLYGSYILDLLG